MPTTPKGGRYLEVHVVCPDSASISRVKFLKQEFLERTYYGDPEGSFECSDPLLNRIWKVGVDTVRACSEDALVDCPTRERGQWTGDVASVSTDICGVAYSDLRLSRRALVQAAQAAREDGLIAGVGPGDPGYLSTYAAQWVSACVHYWELTGDRSVLVDLWPAAERNIAAFEAKMTPQGLNDDLGWGFVDWGYVRNPGPSDIALDLHYLMALRGMTRWQQALGISSTGRDYGALALRMDSIVRAWLRDRLRQPGGWEAVGYQRASLALLAGVVEPQKTNGCIRFIEDHLLTCFPNDIHGPRLSDPGVSSDRVMTPYFCHFSLTALLEHGETAFVLSQYRKCWGWVLSGGDTTWLEVFDRRWSHCHEWSGCPTWQLSRYVLGFKPRFDLGPDVFKVDIHPGELQHASGDIPLPDGGRVHVAWAISSAGVRLRVQTNRPLTLWFSDRRVKVDRAYEATLNSQVRDL